MQLIRLISSLSKNPRIKVCAMQKRSSVPIFNPKLSIPDVLLYQKPSQDFMICTPLYSAVYCLTEKVGVLLQFCE